MSATRPTPLAWHYTTGEKFGLIAASGWLMPATAWVRPPERPILWFSLHQGFEPTARKGTTENGFFRVLSMEETRQRGNGLVRFGRPPRDLLTGEKLRSRAHIARPIWADLAQVGRKQGANPALWFGSLAPMGIDGMFIEVLNDAGDWERVQGDSHD